MAVRDILLVLATHPEATPAPAVLEAIDFAATVGARISGIACEVRFPVPGSFLADLLIDLPALAATEAERSSDNAARLLREFQEAAEKRGVLQEAILEQGVALEVPDLLADYARLHDLTLVPSSDAAFGDQRYAEAIIFGSGRPTLILPTARSQTDHFALKTVVVAWDFSRPAARALGDALPILEMAEQVRVVTVTNEKTLDSRRSGAAVSKHLAAHGLTASLDVVDAADRSIGEVLESYALSLDADLLVMGAYGHSRVRDFILGGATKSMLARPPLPVLLSH